MLEQCKEVFGVEATEKHDRVRAIHRKKSNCAYISFGSPKETKDAPSSPREFTYDLLYIETKPNTKFFRIDFGDL